MTTRLNVETGKFIKLEDNIFVKYYNETIINKLSLSLLFNIWRDMKNSDVVHLQAIFSTPTVITLFHNKFIKKPLLLSPRGSFAPWILKQGEKKKSIWLNILKPLVKDIYWHATATQERDEILALFPDAKVYIVPNGIDLDEYKNPNKLTKKEYIKKYTNRDLEPEYTIISMGRIHAKKGFDILLESFNNLSENYKNSVLLIAGDDEGEQDKLEKLIDKLGLRNRVFFIGSVSKQDKVNFLANSDLFVLPSHNENFGNVYVESLASGTPIVASTNTPWQEVEEYNCGAWVDNSVEKTTIAIEEMLNKLGSDISDNAKILASNYSWKSVAQKFKKVFEEIQGDIDE